MYMPRMSRIIDGGGKKKEMSLGCENVLLQYALFLGQNPTLRPQPLLFQLADCQGDTWWPKHIQVKDKSVLFGNGLTSGSLYIPAGYQLIITNSSSGTNFLKVPTTGPATATVILSSLQSLFYPSSLVAVKDNIYSVTLVGPITSDESFRLDLCMNRATRPVLGMMPLPSYQPASAECDDFMNDYCSKYPDATECACQTEEKQLNALVDQNTISAQVPVTCFGRICSSAGYRWQRHLDEKCSITLCLQVIEALGQNVALDVTSTLSCGNRILSEVTSSSGTTTQPSSDVVNTLYIQNSANSQTVITPTTTTSVTVTVERLQDSSQWPWPVLLVLGLVLIVLFVVLPLSVAVTRWPKVEEASLPKIS